MNRAETLAICGSSNTALTQKLSIPGELLMSGECIIISHANVHDFSAYADAALDADNARW